LIGEGMYALLDLSSLFVSYKLGLVPMDLQVFSFPFSVSSVESGLLLRLLNRYRNPKRCAG
jgi:hypothetical protein